MIVALRIPAGGPSVGKCPSPVLGMHFAPWGRFEDAGMNRLTTSARCALACVSAAFAGDVALAQDTCGESWLVADTDSPGSVAIAYDEFRRETLTQSGGTLWAWNGEAWAVRWTEPLLDGVDAMAYDRNRRVTWIFGGGGYDDRLWKWDGSALTLVANDTIGGRAYVAMAYDWKRDRLVVHGGQSAAQWLYSSWGEYDPSSNQWTTWDNGPVGRLYAHKMVYDPVRERCVMHGGFYFFNRPETWTWDGATWSLATTSGPARYVANMAWDSIRQQVVFHGGTTCCGEVEYASTWTWRGGAWSECSLQGPARGYTNMAFDVHRDRFVLPGGIGPTPSGRQWIPHTNELVMGCSSDVDGDGVVSGSDLGRVLNGWGSGVTDAAADIDRNGVIDGADLGAVLAGWGPCG